MTLFSQKLLFTLKQAVKYLISPKEREKFRSEIQIKKLQDQAIQQFDPLVKKLIVFLVLGSDRITGVDKISGGIISIVSLCEESASLLDEHKGTVLLCTLFNERLLWKHTQFKNNTNIFRFVQLSQSFINVEEVIIHIPEFTCQYFLDYLPRRDFQWLAALKKVHINILNQNIRLMPTQEVINRLKDIANLITVTTAHQRYCNMNYRQQYGVPLHKFSVWISPEKYAFREYKKKRNLLIVSPDPHPEKQHILDELKLIAGLQIQIIENLTYEEYKDVISSAKFALTFGEGLDGYILEPIFSGAIGLAVYNEEFFTPDFGELQTVYPSYDVLKEKIISDLALLDDEDTFKAYQTKQYNMCAKYYSYKTYQDNILQFYKGHYTFP